MNALPLPIRIRAESVLFCSALAVTIACAGCGRESGAESVEATRPTAVVTLASDAAPTYVSSPTCARCHEPEHAAWADSHHDLAMQHATEDAVLGDFDDASFTYGPVTSTFSRRDDRFFVRTDGPDGELADYEIAYAFGVTPLQQYLVEFPGGRYQALGLAWDTRPSEEGGQRWFHLYPDDAIEPGDPLHWTGRDQNWNYQCAECHSTDLKKNYDPTRDVYDTTWAEIDVACEACHGPGSRHVAWADALEEGQTYDVNDDMGLVVRMKDRDEGAWVHDLETGTAKRTVPRTNQKQIEICARCHSRRGLIEEAYVYGGELLQTHRLQTLAEPYYHADGQILDEVYVYGSFVQSKMFHEGVTCSDCHDPHSLRLRADGNAVCYTCHLPDRFDTPDHHFHTPGEPGSSCVECHMPTRDYMVVDPRLDHSIRVPRPDLSVALGTPNACTGCHADQTPQWSADAVAEWYGDDRRREPRYGEALHAGRTGRPGAVAALAALAADVEQPAIARATAVELLGRIPRPEAGSTIAAMVDDDEPLVRVAAVQSLRTAAPQERLRNAVPLLDDPVRLVRIAAARVLAPFASNLEASSYRDVFTNALAELIASEQANADRAEAHMNLGLVYTDLRQHAEAEAAYRHALRLEPGFVQALVNLADLYRVQGRDEEGERALRTAIEHDPEAAAAHHALGLLLIRRQQIAEAMAALERAARLAPESARYGYVYAVALQSIGMSREALVELQLVHERVPTDLDTIRTLALYYRDAGDLDIAVHYARKLVEVAGDDESQQLLQMLQASRP